MSGPDTSLENLRDIFVPEPPPLWPPAPGIWVILIIAVAVVLALTVWWRRVRARNAYRRAGLALLADARTARDVNIILKRVALAAFSRPLVASLYGEDWVAFLDGTCQRARFASLDVIDSGAEPPPELQNSARFWIQHHRPAQRGTT